jgi:LysM repeat protein
MRFTIPVFAFAAFASSALAHMEMTEPAPFRSKDNKFTTNVDFDMTSPLSASGDNFPCKGYQSDFNTPAGTSTASWAAGSEQQITIEGGAAHDGGSCQLSISYDEGKTFRVIKSIEGNCPAQGTSNFGFTVPAEAKSGKVIFAWTWFNHTGNREMYMNCAAVDITGSGTSTLEDRPEIFKANINNGCTVPEGTDVQFPDPGPALQVLSQASLGPPTGDCGGSPPTPEPSEEPSSSAPAESPEPSESSEPVDEEPIESATASTSASASASDTYSAEPEPTDTPTATQKPVSSSASADPASTTSTATPPDNGDNGDGTTYTVVAGDFCETIAQEHDVPLSHIFELNTDINTGCTNLKPGQVLNLRRRSRIMRGLY